MVPEAIHDGAFENLRHRSLRLSKPQDVRLRDEGQAKREVR